MAAATPRELPPVRGVRVVVLWTKAAQATCASHVRSSSSGVYSGVVVRHPASAPVPVADVPGSKSASSAA